MAKFNRICTQLEEYTLEHYPSLNQPRLRAHRSINHVRSHNEQQLLNRTGSSRRENLAQKARDALETHVDTTDLALKLHAQGIRVVRRGDTLTLAHGQMRARLGTLGLESHESLLASVAPIHQSMQEKIRDLRNYRAHGPYSNEKGFSRTRSLTQSRSQNTPQTPSEPFEEPTRYIVPPKLPELSVGLPTPRIPPRRWHVLIRPPLLAIWDSSVKVFVTTRTLPTTPLSDLLSILQDELAATIDRLKEPKTCTTYELDKTIAEELRAWLKSEYPTIRYRARSTPSRLRLPEALKNEMGE